MQFLGVFVLVLLGLEILSIFLVASWFGGLATLILMVVSFLGGRFLMRGQNNISKVLLSTAMMRGSGGMSLYQMLWPIRIPFAGVLLMLPGFLSTVLAIVLLLPFKGKPSTTSNHGFSGHFEQGAFRYESRTRHNDDDIIEGDFVVRSPSSQSTAQHQSHIEHRS